jgi:hypothetical protein
MLDAASAVTRLSKRITSLPRHESKEAILIDLHYLRVKLINSGTLRKTQHGDELLHSQWG